MNCVSSGSHHVEFNRNWEVWRYCRLRAPATISTNGLQPLAVTHLCWWRVVPQLPLGGGSAPARRGHWEPKSSAGGQSSALRAQVPARLELRHDKSKIDAVNSRTRSEDYTFCLCGIDSAGEIHARVGQLRQGPRIDEVTCRK